LCGGDREKASTAVAQAFARAADQPSLLGGGRGASELARLTYLSCADLFPDVDQRGDEDQPAVGVDTSRARPSRGDLRRRALLALTMYGNFTYNEAASMLRLEPASAAELLRTTLRESAQPGSDTSPNHGPPR
jgi:hypothetical protein